jgi:hypothetical protein
LANERLYRENVLFALAEPEAFANRSAPTAAELNGALVYNVTCAIWEDDTEFTLGDPDTDDGLTYCSKAGFSSPTFDNPTVTFSALLDADRTATGVFNGTRKRIAFPDRTFLAIERIGHDSDVAFAAGDEIKMVLVKTDYRVPVVGSGDNARINQTFLPQGFVNWNYKVLS